MGSLGSRDASGGKGNIYFLIDIVVNGISLSCDILLPSSRTMLYRRECNVQRKESWPGKYGYLKTSLCRRVQAMVQVSLKTFLYFMILVTTRGVKFFETCCFLGQPLTLWTQSTSSMIQRSPDADVSQIWIWMSPGKKNPAKSLAMCIVLKRGLLHPKKGPNHQKWS